MYILIVNFELKEITPEEYQMLCEKLAPVYVTMPGLLSKVWLADSVTNTYGGVYTWESRASMEAYLASEIFRGIANHPNLVNVSARTFGILEGPSRVTQGLMQAAAL